MTPDLEVVDCLAKVSLKPLLEMKGMHGKKIVYKTEVNHCYELLFAL